MDVDSLMALTVYPRFLKYFNDELITAADIACGVFGLNTAIIIYKAENLLN